MSKFTRGILFLVVGIIALFIFLATWARDGRANALGGGGAATGIITGLILLIKDGAFTPEHSRRRGGGNTKNIEKKYASNLTGIFDYSRGLRRKLVSAMKLYDKGEYQKAAEEFGKLLEKSDTTRDYCGLQRLIAKASRALKDYEKELAAYEAAVERDPGNYMLWRELGSLQKKRGMNEQAEQSWKKDFQLSRSTEACVNLAGLYNAEGRYTEAIKQAEKALKVNSRMKNAYLELCCSYKGLGDAEKMAENIKKCIQNGMSEHSVQVLVSAFKPVVPKEPAE